MEIVTSSGRASITVFYIVDSPEGQPDDGEGEMHKEQFPGFPPTGYLWVPRGYLAATSRLRVYARVHTMALRWFSGERGG